MWHKAERISGKDFLFLAHHVLVARYNHAKVIPSHTESVLTHYVKTKCVYALNQKEKNGTICMWAIVFESIK